MFWVSSCRGSCRRPKADLCRSEERCEEVDRDSWEYGVRLQGRFGADFNLEQTVSIPAAKPKLFLAFLSQSQEHVGIHDNDLPMRDSCKRWAQFALGQPVSPV